MGKAKKKRGHGKKHGKQTFNPITNECYIEKDEELEDDAKPNKSDHLDKILDTVSIILWYTFCVQVKQDFTEVFSHWERRAVRLVW